MPNLKQKTQILHISDLHLSESNSFDHQIKLSSLIERIEDDRAMRGLSPELIMITGDLAYSGKRSEYDLVSSFLDNLRTATGLDTSHLFVVPGNHDVDLDAYGLSEVPFNSYSSVEKLNKELCDTAARKRLMRGQEAYFKFVTSYCPHLKGIENGLVPFVYSHTTQCEKRMSIIGLNSAWMFRRDSQKQQIAIGEYQVERAIKKMRDAGAFDLSLVMVHHPMDWLWPNDIERCKKFFDHSILLTGHIHRTRTFWHRGAHIDYLSLQTGATYQDENRTGSQFHYITLDWNSLEVRVDYRKWNYDTNRWHAHCELGNDGIKTFTMPGHKAWRPPESVSPIPPSSFGHEPAFGVRIHEKSQCDDFHALIKEKMRKAQRIVLIGTGLNVLQNDAFALEIMENIRDNPAGRSMEIFLANPFSPDVESRLIEEETGNYLPPVGKSGLLSRLRTFLDLWKNVGYPKEIRLRLFTHYPTFALIIADDNYFIYPYGYATLGNFSPVIQFFKGDPISASMIQFLDDQYNLVRKNAQDLKETIDLHDMKAAANIDMPAFAFYFIPQVNTGFYKFGSEVLGYDVRKEKEVESNWHAFVGGARRFGFHLTLCDALYFQTASERKRACKEVEFVLKNFKRFEIENMEIRAQFPDKSSISIVPVDRTGNLEALHHELVQRVYRRAAGSDYSFNRAEIKRFQNDASDPRNLLMINRYRAPYILSKFAPHFTLLTEVPEDKMIQISRDLQKKFLETTPSRSVSVHQMAIMTTPDFKAPWKIEQEIPLQ